jgi:hypothetical protein
MLRWRNYRRSLHGWLVIVALAIFGITLGFGLSFRPTSGPPIAQVPHSLMIIQTDEYTPDLHMMIQYGLSGTATDVGSVYRITISFAGYFPGGHSDWRVNLSRPFPQSSTQWYPCHGARNVGLTAITRGKHKGGWTFTGSTRFASNLDARPADSKPSDQGGEIGLCVSGAQPVVNNDPYMTAEFPVLAYIPEGAATDYSTTSTQTDSLSGNLIDYSLQSGPSPENMWSEEWDWEPAYGLDAQESDLGITAVNLPELNSGNQSAFLSGILFGVAGAALLAVVSELLVALKSHGKAELTGEPD